MAKCPECETEIFSLYVERSANEDGSFSVGEGFYDMEVQRENLEFSCPECGEILAKDEEEAREILGEDEDG